MNPAPDHRTNNFNGLRLLFAVLVLFAHAFTLAAPGEDPVLIATGGRISLARLAVNGFFVISGFLVWRSLLASASVWDYLRKRALRIFPALIVITLLCVAVLGPLVTTLSAHGYWADPATRAYALNPLWMLRGGVRFELPGVFTDAPITAVNSSLWTIPYELFCYGFVLLRFPLRRAGRMPAVVLGALFIAVALAGLHPWSGSLPHTSFAYDTLTDVLPFFLGGAFIAQLNGERYLTNWMLPAALTALLMADLLWLTQGRLEHMLLPPLVIGLAYLPVRWSLPTQFGDISYGLYLAGWPAQQLLFHSAGVSGWALFGCSLVAAVIYGLLSWHLLEKHALAWRRPVSASAAG